MPCAQIHLCHSFSSELQNYYAYLYLSIQTSIMELGEGLFPFFL